MALHLQDLRPDPDQCFDHRGLLHDLSPKNVGPALARLAAFIARNVPSLRFHTVGSKLLICQATGPPIPRTAFGISNFCLGPVRKPEHRMATRIAHPRLPTPQARGTSPKKKPATRANAAQLSLSGIFLDGVVGLGHANLTRIPSFGSARGQHEAADVLPHGLELAWDGAGCARA